MYNMRGFAMQDGSNWCFPYVVEVLLNVAPAWSILLERFPGAAVMPKEKFSAIEGADD
jgi:hypothetical protein